MSEYSITSLIQRAKGRVYSRKAFGTKSLFNLVICKPDGSKTTIEGLTYHEAKAACHKQRLRYAIELLGLNPDQEELRLEQENKDRSYKFDDDIRWLVDHLDIKLNKPKVKIRV